MKRSTQLYDEGLEQYPLRHVVIGNLLLLAIIAAGTAACWFISPFFGVAYLVCFTVLVYGVLRRLICTNCHYYGKRCGTGWGALAALWFSRGSLEAFNRSPGLRLAPLVYGLMILVPLICLAVLLVQQATSTLVLLAAFLLAAGFHLTGPGRRRTCSVCRMRLFCRGSAAR